MNSSLSYKFFRLRVFSFCFFIAVFIFPLQANAETTALEKRVFELEKSLKSRSEFQEIWDRFSFKGKFKLRHEGLFRNPDNATNKTDRQRQRFQFRFGGSYKLYDDLDVGLRFATGGTNPTSSDASFENSAATKDFGLDRAYIRYEKSFMAVTAGKFGVPFLKTELLWDGDLSIEGASEQLQYKIKDTTFKLNLGQVVIDEISGLNDDPYLLAFQGVIEREYSFAKPKLGIGLFHFKNLKGNTIDNNPSNSNSLTSGAHTFDFSVLDILGQMDFYVHRPIKVLAEYATNIADDAKLDKAWRVGFYLNEEVKELWDWQIRYFYSLVQTDAVFANWSDSDFNGGGTNAKGMEIGMEVGLRKGIRFSGSYFITQEERGPKDRLDRMQLDMILIF